MDASVNIPAPQRNRLLATLDATAQARVFPYLEPVRLPVGASLHEPGASFLHVYFPVNCIVSVLYELADGAATDIAIVGNDGLVGVSAFMSGQGSPNRALVRTAGHAWRLLGARLRGEFDRHEHLEQLLLRYERLRMLQAAQMAVCNRHHTIHQQLCCWLLHALDRLPDNHLAITQSLLADMLGVRREGITGAAVDLHRQGVIDYRRGHILVRDRPRLEQLSCECYGVIARDAERLFPAVARPA